jgi:hypothetical protein
MAQLDYAPNKLLHGDNNKIAQYLIKEHGVKLDHQEVSCMVEIHKDLVWKSHLKMLATYMEELEEQICKT